MNIATAFVELRVDTSKAKGEAETKTRALAGDLGRTFATVFGAAAFGAGLKKSIDAASDLNETVSKTEQIFGAASSDVIAFADDAARAMGMSKTAYLDAASGLKGLLDNMGLTSQESTRWSQDLVALGSDLGSFFNRDPAEAVAAIGSALRGEAEPIRAFNVLIDEAKIKAKALELGLYSGTGAIEANAKAQATMALIMEQTSVAQGDFARTADGVANSQRTAAAEAENAAASLGQNFLPIYQRIVQLVGLAAEGFGALPGPIQLGVVALAGMVALSGPIRGIVTLFGDLTTKIRNLSPAMRSAAVGLTAIGTVVFAGLSLRAKAVADANAELAASFDELSRASDAQVLDALTASLGKGIIAGKDANDVFTQLAETNLEGAKRALELADAQAAAGQLTDEQVGIYDRLRAAIEAEEVARGNAKTTTEQHGAAAGDATTALEGQATAAEEAAESTATLADALSGATDEYDELAQAADDLREAIDKLRDPMLNQEKALEDIANGTRELDEQIWAAVAANEAGATSFDLNTEAGTKNRQAVRDQIDAFIDLGIALVQSGKSNEEATGAVNTHIEGLREQLRQLGFNEDEVAAYVSALNATPTDIETAIALAGQEQAKRELEAINLDLNEIDKGARAQIEAAIARGDFIEAKRLIDAIPDRKVVTIIANVALGSVARGVTIGLAGSAYGRFVPGGSNLVSSLGEVSGSSGDEVVLPLGRPDRISELLADERVGPRVAAATGGGTGSPVGSAGPITLIIEGRPFTAMIAEHDQQMALALAAGRRR